MAVMAGCGGDGEASSAGDAKRSTTTSVGGEATRSTEDKPKTTTDVTLAPDVEVEEVEGALGECATGLPVPPGAFLIDTAIGRTGDGRSTCVISVAHDEGIPAVVDAWESASKAAGWRAEVKQREDNAGYLHLRGDLCAVTVVLSAREALDSRVEKADGRPTVSLVSVVPCEVLDREPSE